MIEFDQVSKAYRGGMQALQKVSFKVEEGEMVFLNGHSGAGKSTLLKLITAIEEPTDGTIYFNGHDISHLSKKDIPFLRRNIGVVYQEHRLLNNKTVYDNVALPMRVESMNEAEVKRRVSAALDRLEISDKALYYPEQLSGGEQQRVGIARAIVNRPSIVLADEPTGNLDAKLSESVMRLFEDFNQSGVTIIVATHDMALVENRFHIRRLELNQGFLHEAKGHG